jgi:hypothetical protein
MFIGAAFHDLVAELAYALESGGAENKFPYGNQELTRGAVFNCLAASRSIFSKFPYSNQGCYAAPVWG